MAEKKRERKHYVEPAKRVPTKAEIEVMLAETRSNLEKYGTLEAPAEALWTKTMAECPNCHHVGPIVPDFGLKKNRKGLDRPQSWCHRCRNSPDAHPARLRFGDDRSPRQA